MDRVYKSGGTAVAPNAADNASGPYPRAGDPGTGTPATKPGPFWFHMITEELAKFIEAAGVVLDKTSLTQLIDAAKLLFDSQGIDPGGRLTLTTAVPVTTADVAGAASHYYTPYKHNRVKLYDGTRWKWYTIGELTQAANDNTKSPAAVAANKNYDVFVWDDAGTVRATRGPDWTAGAVAGSDVARGTGANSTELEFFEGRWVSKNAITNGPAARRGLYVGTLRSDAASQYNDTLAKRHVWNTYNRVVRPMRAIDTTDSWTYSTGSYRQANGSNANQLDFVRGLNEDSVAARVLANVGNSTSSLRNVSTAVGLDSATVTAGLRGQDNIGSLNRVIVAFYDDVPGLGRHFLAWLEKGDGADVQTWLGDNAGTQIQAGINGECLA